MDKPFQFKQFSVAQDRTAMKIGSDGVLLGAWTPLETDPESILDIGAGTGVIALMLAQRSEAEIIDAVEIEEQAFEQCVENFEASPWSDRLFCFHASLDELVSEPDQKYDLIVSNPPFFSENTTTGNPSRDLARRNSSLPFESLLEGIKVLLAPAGLFSVIIPFREEEKFLELGKQAGLYANRITRVRGHAAAPLKRSLICLSFRHQPVMETELTIEISRHQYSAEYIRLTSEFYLNM